MCCRLSFHFDSQAVGPLIVGSWSLIAAALTLALRNLVFACKKEEKKTLVKRNIKRRKYTGPGSQASTGPLAGPWVAKSAMLKEEDV